MTRLGACGALELRPGHSRNLICADGVPGPLKLCRSCAPAGAASSQARVLMHRRARLPLQAICTARPGASWEGKLQAAACSIASACEDASCHCSSCCALQQLQQPPPGVLMTVPHLMLPLSRATTSAWRTACGKTAPCALSTCSTASGTRPCCLAATPSTLTACRWESLADQPAWLTCSSASHGLARMTQPQPE